MAVPGVGPCPGAAGRQWLRAVPVRPARLRVVAVGHRPRGALGVGWPGRYRARAGSYVYGCACTGRGPAAWCGDVSAVRFRRHLVPLRSRGVRRGIGHGDAADGPVGAVRRTARDADGPTRDGGQAFSIIARVFTPAPVSWRIPYSRTGTTGRRVTGQDSNR